MKKEKDDAFISVAVKDIVSKSKMAAIDKGLVAYNTFYASWHEAMAGLTDEQYGRLARAINDYCFHGGEPELTGVEKVIFIMARPNINASTAKKKAGRKGSEKRWGGIEEEEPGQESRQDGKAGSAIIAPCNGMQYSDEKEKEKENVKEKTKEKEKTDQPDSFFDPLKTEPESAASGEPAKSREDAAANFQKAREKWNSLGLIPGCRDLIMPPAHYDSLATFQNYNSDEILNAIQNYDWHRSGRCGAGWKPPPPYGSIYGFLKTGVARYYDDNALDAQFKEPKHGP